MFIFQKISELKKILNLYETVDRKKLDERHLGYVNLIFGICL